MKKIVIFLCIALKVYSQEYDLNHFIKNYLNNSKDSRIYKNDQKKEILKETQLKLGKYSKLNLSVDDYYYTDYDDDDYENMNDHILDYSLSYGIFSHTLTYNHKKSEITSNSFTIKKSLNEFINNDYSYNYEINKIKNDISQKRREVEKLDRIKNIISQYIKIKKLEDELSVKNSSYKILFEEKKQLEEKLQNGDIKKLDLDLLNLNLETTYQDIENIKEKIKTEKILLFSDADIEYSEAIQLKEPMNIFKLNYYNINKYEYEISKLEDQISGKELKHTKLNNLPEISAYTTYDIKHEGYKIGLSLSKEFDIINYDTKEAKLNKENSSINFEKSKKTRVDSIKKAKLDYGILVNEDKRLLSKKRYKEKELKIYTEIYKENLISYIELAKKREETENAQLDYLNNHLDLIEFELKINAVNYLNINRENI